MLNRLVKRMLRVLGTELSPYSPALYAELHDPDTLARKPFYNLGSGHWRHPHWTNVDYQSDYYGYQSDQIDIHWDIVSGEPIKVDDGVAELAYCSHTVEHLLDQHVDHMLREACRILKPGGVIRITTPNVEQFYWAYRRRDRHFNFHYGHAFPFGAGDHTYSVRRMPIWYANEVATQLVQGVGEERRGAKLLENVEAIEAIIDDASSMEEGLSKLCGMIDFDLQREVPGQHVNWWTVDKLRNACLRAGFSHAVVNVAGGSIAPEMRDRHYFDLVDATFSIFVDAIK